MQYEQEFLSGTEEQTLPADVQRLGFQSFEMHGREARRRVAHFGLDYAYAGASVSQGEPLPDFLLPLQNKVAKHFDMAPESLVEVLVTEYRPGAGIGWHRDAPAFGRVAGVSLLAACRFRMRRLRANPPETLDLMVEPRSVYLLTGSARWQ